MTDLTVPEWVQPREEVPTYGGYGFWTPSRTEHALVALSILCALLLGWTIGTNNGYEAGARDGIRYGTSKVCDAIPVSHEWTERCR